MLFFFLILGERREKRGKLRVKNYEDHVLWLMENDSSIRREVLRFGGKNVVLFSDFGIREGERGREERENGC